MLTVVGVLLGGLATVFAMAALGAGSMASAEEPVGGDEPAAATAVSTVVTLTATISPTFDLPDYAEEESCFPLEVVADPALQVVDVEVEVAVEHTWVGDLILRLVSPGGPYVTMLHRPGSPDGPDGDSSNLDAGAPLTFAGRFDDDAETMGSTLADAAVICQSDDRCEYYPNRDEDGGSLPTFAGLAGTVAPGSWQFCASDNNAGDVGTLHWVTLRMTAAEPPPVFDVYLPMVRR